MGPYVKLIVAIVLPLLGLTLIRADCASDYLIGFQSMWVNRYGSPADARRLQDEVDVAFAAETGSLELYEFGRLHRLVVAEMVAAGIPPEEAGLLATHWVKEQEAGGTPTRSGCLVAEAALAAPDVDDRPGAAASIAAP